jgi:prepilin-type N-terminal cleavage/methylation domain-containing protein
MPIVRRDAGFTLIELMVALSITVVILGTALGTFSNAVSLNETATLVADANQNLRAGTNMLVRDLMQAGRGIDTGGIPIPCGPGALPILRPGPPGTSLTFDNTTATTLPAVITGHRLGPVVTGRPTDIVTMLSTDPTSLVQFGSGSVPRPLPLNVSGALPAGITSPAPALASDGASLNVGQFDSWLTDPSSKIKPGDLLLFNNANGRALQTVTRVSGTDVHFEAGDPFQLNQRSVSQGSIVQIRGGAAFPQTDVVRVTMLTYYVDAATTPGAPRLMRRINHFPAEALAGVVEDLNLTWDLVDGSTNPTEVPDLPATIGGVLFSSNQIRKANLRVGVRSDTTSRAQMDHVRHHVSTVVSLRSLAYVDRYR